jgi:hypothetical protein
MGSLKVEKFGGMLPAWDDRNIPQDQASFAQNAYLYSGAHIGWRQPELLRALTTSAAKFAYRIPTISQGVAGANLVFVQNPVNGDQVTLGEVTYTFKTMPVNPYDVLIGSTTVASAEALFMAINFGSYDTAVVGADSATGAAVTNANAYLGYPFQFYNLTNAPPANSVILVPVTPSDTMNLSQVSVMPAGSSAGAHFTGVVYEDTYQINQAGTAYIHIPTSLVATGAQVVGCTTGQPIVSAFGTNITLQEGSTYWIGFIMDTSVPLNQSSNGTLGVSMSNTYTNGPPNPFQTTELTGVTTGGTTVGSLESAYNQNQPNWQLWGTMAVLTSSDPINTLNVATIQGGGPFPYLSLQAPEFGAAYNQTPVAESTNGARLAWTFDLASLSDRTTLFTGGANQTSDTTITGASAWLEFLDQDTNVLRTPVVDDEFQRYYWASPSLPPQYNTYDRIKNGQSPWLLGVPAPPIAPTLAVAGGGNPTQIGFPGSNTATTYNFLQPYNVGGTEYYGQLPVNDQVDGDSILVLYPMQTSVEATLASISVQVATLGANANFLFRGVIFADVSATSLTESNAPGDIIAVGSQGELLGSAAPTLPQAVTSVMGTTPTLTANTQYWIGALLDGGGFINQYIPNGNMTLALGDTKAQGLSSIVQFGQLSALPTDATTGSPEAPSNMTTGFPDLQLWGNLTPGTSGEAQEETRAYVYTWVTAYGEEGPPSPPALLDAYDNATWNVGLQPPLKEDMGTLRNIVQTNLYRTMSSVQGGTVFFLVASFAATCSNFADNVTDDVVADNLILPSTTWFGPPTNLQGMVTMPNGMIAGFKGNEVWFCEPFRPHAWPSGYVMTTDYPIVGLGVSGASVVACTQYNPQVFTGVNPNTVTQQRIPLPEPCTSRGGILSTENGVYYPSVNGLIKVSGNGYAVNTTQDWITREKWDFYTPQKFVRAAKNVSTYFAFGTTGVTNGTPDTSVAQQGFTIELSEIANTQSFTIWPQVGGHRIGFGTLSAPNGANIDNVLTDPWSGVTLLIAGGNTYYYDFPNPAPTITKSIWRSKKFQGPNRENYDAFRVWFDIPPGGPQTPPASRTEVPFVVSPTATLAYAPGMFGVVRIIADGNYITERELRYSTELMRITSAQKYTTWQVEIEGVVSVTNIKLATSVKELRLAK